jgi:hypothetical protein
VLLRPLLITRAANSVPGLTLTALALAGTQDPDTAFWLAIGLLGALVGPGRPASRRSAARSGASRWAYAMRGAAAAS